MTGVYIEPAMPWSAPVAGRVYSHTCGRDQFLYINDGYGVSWLTTLDVVGALPADFMLRCDISNPLYRTDSFKAARIVFAWRSRRAADVPGNDGHA